MDLPLEGPPDWHKEAEVDSILIQLARKMLFTSFTKLVNHQNSIQIQHYSFQMEIVSDTSLS